MKYFFTSFALIVFFVFSISYDTNAQDLFPCNGLSTTRPSNNTPSAWDYCACEIDNSYCLCFGVEHPIN